MSSLFRGCVAWVVRVLSVPYVLAIHFCDTAFYSEVSKGDIGAAIEKLAVSVASVW